MVTILWRVEWKMPLKKKVHLRKPAMCLQQAAMTVISKQLAEDFTAGKWIMRSTVLKGKPPQWKFVPSRDMFVAMMHASD